MYPKLAVLAAAIGVICTLSLLWADEGDAPTDPPIRFAESATPHSTDGTAKRTRPNKHDPVDPIEANGRIFVDWPKPAAVIVFSGEQSGYLEPCGCTGLHNQKGGLKRRHTLIKQLEEKGWPTLALDNGGLVRRFGKQAEIKYERSLESLAEIGYAAVGFGAQDLRMDLLPKVINLDPGNNFFVSANVGILDFESGFTERFRVVEVGGLKIGVTSVLGKGEIDKLNNVTDVVFEEPYQAIPKVLPQLLAAECDQLVLLAHAEQTEAIDLAKRFHEFDWVVSAKGPEEPPNAPSPILDDTGQPVAQLIEVGTKGKYVVAVGLYPNEPKKFLYQRVPLDHRFEDSPQMQRIFTAYQQELETLGLEGLGIRPIDHSSGKEFAGTAVCADCHTEAHSVHDATPHAHATQTLVEIDPPRHYDPECLSCHATGWHPQKYFPFTTGYLSLEDTPHMRTNGCENCHGPGKRHADAELGNINVSDEEAEALKAALRLKLVDNEGNQTGQEYGKVVDNCMQCHDLDNSPDFDFQLYWPEVEHYGME